DMTRDADRSEVLRALEQEIRKDRARSRMLQISEFGLVEITRQRSRPSLERALCSPCASCGGSGRGLSPESVRLEILREARLRHAPAGEGTLVARVHPEVAAALAPGTVALADAIGLRPERFSIVADPSLRPDQWSLQRIEPD